jgi:hypothetical protein
LREQNEERAKFIAVALAEGKMTAINFDVRSTIPTKAGCSYINESHQMIY